MGETHICDNGDRTWITDQLHDVQQLRAGLAALLDWAACLGGWEAPCWRQARQVYARTGRAGVAGHPAWRDPRGAAPRALRPPAAWRGGAQETLMPTYLYATLTTHLERMLAVGLDPATELPPGVELHTPSHTPGAVLEVMERHGVPLTAVIILAVRVPRRWLQRMAPGRWQCTRVIAPARLAVYATGEEVAASPVPNAEEE